MEFVTGTWDYGETGNTGAVSPWRNSQKFLTRTDWKNGYFVLKRVRRGHLHGGKKR